MPLSLEPKAFNLLLLMIQRPGHLFSKQEIFDAVWPDTAVTDHALTRVVAQLRRVLGDDVKGARYLETVPTRGYRWIQPIERIDQTQEPAAPGEPGLAAEAMPNPPARPRRIFQGVAAGLSAVVVSLGLLAWSWRGTPTSADTPVDGKVGGAAAAKGSSEFPWPVQLTTYDGLDMHPAFSPQSDAVAFSSDRTGGFEIYVRALGGTATEVALTNDGGQNVHPVWSPDGALIAFHSDRRGGIWIIPSRGGTPKQITASGANPSWSPDGLRLAYQSDEHADVAPAGFGAQSGSTIRVVDADGRNDHQVTELGRPAGGHALPAWSRDGRHLTFSVFDGGQSNGVWMLSLDTRETRVLESGKGLYETAFAPDGSAVYIAGGEAMIVRIPLDAATGRRDGARQVIPVPGVAGVRGLTIAADGRRIGFAGVTLSSQIWSQAIAKDGSASGPPAALTSDTSRRNSMPAVSPDGSKVAYMSSRRGQLPNIWLMAIDGSQAVQLTSDEAAEHTPEWFRDGKRVAYPSNREDALRIYSVDVATRREELMFDAAAARREARAQRIEGRLAELDLAPSMSRAAFSIMAPPTGRRVLYVTGIDRFSPRALTDGTSSVGYPAWSPDERYLAVELKDGSSTQAAIVDVQTGTVRTLTDDRGQTWVRSWSPDGRKIAVAALRDRLWNLRWIDVETGRQGDMTAPVPPRQFVRYPSWSPRGDRVVYERGEMRGNIWMLTLR